MMVSKLIVGWEAVGGSKLSDAPDVVVLLDASRAVVVELGSDDACKDARVSFAIKLR